MTTRMKSLIGFAALTAAALVGFAMHRRRSLRRMLEYDTDDEAMGDDEDMGDEEKSIDAMLAEAIASLEDLMAMIHVKSVVTDETPDFYTVLNDVAEGDDAMHAKALDIENVLQAEIPDVNDLEAKANAFLDLVEERVGSGEHDDYVELASALSGLLQKTMTEMGDEMIAAVTDPLYGDDTPLSDDVDGDNANAWDLSDPSPHVPLTDDTDSGGTKA